jgi:hypothetical protein
MGWYCSGFRVRKARLPVVKEPEILELLLGISSFTLGYE